MIKTSLRPYQKEAVARGIKYPGFLFLPEQRTGKCLISLAVIDHHRPDYVFIFGPKNAISVWRRQIAEHLVNDWGCKFGITNFEEGALTPESRERYRKLYRRLRKGGRTVMTICDEAHKIKNRGKLRSRFIRSLGKLSDFRLALTGTVISQGVQDAWAPFDFIMPGVFGKFAPTRKELFKEGRTPNTFSELYLRYGGYQGRKVVGYRNQQRFQSIFQEYSYRITFRDAKKSVGETPPKIHRVKIPVKLKAKSWEHYREFEEQLETVVRGTKVSTAAVVALTTKLQQIAGGFLIHEKKVIGKRRGVITILKIGREKLLTLMELITSPDFKAERFVICCRFTHEIDEIRAGLNLLKFSNKTIEGGSQFDGNFDVNVILLQIQTAEAFDLSAANHYIFYSWDFSHITHEQSKFRVLSFATKQVNYYYLMATGTVDEDIYQAVVKKKDLATLVCDRYRRKRENRKAVGKREGRAKQAHPSTS